MSNLCSPTISLFPLRQVNFKCDAPFFVFQRLSLKPTSGNAQNFVPVKVCLAAVPVPVVKPNSCRRSLHHTSGVGYPILGLGSSVPQHHEAFSASGRGRARGRTGPAGAPPSAGPSRTAAGVQATPGGQTGVQRRRGARRRWHSPAGGAPPAPRTGPRQAPALSPAGAPPCTAGNGELGQQGDGREQQRGPDGDGQPPG